MTKTKQRKLIFSDSSKMSDRMLEYMKKYIKPVEKKRDDIYSLFNGNI